MKPIKVMVVDDSAFMRVVIKDLLESDPSVKVIETAQNGLDALEKLKEMDTDIITLDVEMPILDGIDTLEKLIEKGVNIPIIMLSSTTKLGIENTIKALHLGAFDFITKPSVTNSYSIDKVKEKLLQTIKLAMDHQVKHTVNYDEVEQEEQKQTASTRREVVQEEQKQTASTRREVVQEEQKQSLSSRSEAEQELQKQVTPKLDQKRMIKRDSNIVQSSLGSLPLRKDRQKEIEEFTSLHKLNQNNRLKQIILVGTSTGGPKALQQLLTLLPKQKHAAVLIVQHMPPSFTNSLAKRLDQLTEHDVVEAQHDDEIKAGHIYIAPGGYHMQLAQKNKKAYIALNNEAPRGGHRPSVDVLIESSVEIEGFKLISVIMTGMGKDGLVGTKLLKEKKLGYTIAEDRSTCVVYGMPRAIIEAGLADEIVPLYNIPLAIEKIIKS